MNVHQRPRRGAIGALVRERVDAMLDQVWDYRLSLVVAPAGSGKTTAMQQFMSRSSPVGWCAAEELELSPDGCVAEIARRLGDTIDMKLDGSSPAALADTLDEWSGERVTLIIDDLHGIAATLAESELGRLIDAQPAKLSIVAGTRALPEFDISLLQVRGELLVITGDDLRFRMSEADRLLREHYDVILGPNDVATLVSRLEGWAAGLQLYNLAARGRPMKVRRQLITDPGGSRLGRDYLARNVLSGLPPEILTFLMATAALPELTPALCNQLTGRTDAAQVLDFLERNQLFTIPVDHLGTYRYHEVLRGYLDARLEERDGPERAAAHHRRVGELLEGNGRPSQALQAYSRAGAWDAVSRLVLDGVQHRDVGDAWLELVPSTTVENDPTLLLARARHRVRSGRIAGGVRDFERAEAAALTPTLVATCREERADVEAWVEPTLPPPNGWTASLHHVVRLGRGQRQRNVDLSDPEAAVVSGIDALLDGDLDIAVSRIEAAQCHPAISARAALVADFAAVAARGLMPVFAALAGGPGRPTLPAGLVEAVVEHAEQGHLGWAARVAHALRALTANADGCRDARLVRAACRHDGDKWGAALAGMFEGMGALLRGEFDPDPLLTSSAGFNEIGSPRLAQLSARVADEMVARHSAEDADRRAETTEALPASVRRADVDPVAVRCFGSLELIVDGRRVDLSGVRPRALSVLRLLALHTGQGLHRETIMESLWHDVDPDAARRGLHVALSSVRRTLPVRAELRIVRHGEAYELAVAPDAFFDVAAFRDAAEAAAAARRDGDQALALDRALNAVAIYRGDLLIDEGPSEWVVRQRDALRLDLVAAARVAGDAALQLGTPQAAIGAIERGLSVDRYADPLWRLLISVHEQAGDKATAMRLRGTFVEAMADLGVS